MARTIDTETKGGSTPVTPRARRNALDSFMEGYVSKSVPMLVEGYLRLGQHDKAMAFAKFAEDRKTQTAMRQWAGAMQSWMLGDTDGALNQIADYNNSFDTGYTVIKEGSRIDRDESGNIVGMTVALTGPDGKRFEQKIDGNEGFLANVFTAIAPEKMFDMLTAQVTAANQARATSARDRIQHQLNIELARIRGKGDPNVREAAIKFLAENDPSFVNLTPEQREAKIEEWIATMSSDAPATPPPTQRGI